jgi:SNF family Na+-dependent transporter
MQIDFVTLIFGMTLAVVGWLLAGRSRACLRQHLQVGITASAEVADQFHARRQRRRFQASVLMILLGVLIACTDVLPLLTSSAYAASLYVTAALALALWLMILGILDGVQSMQQFRTGAGAGKAGRIRGTLRLREGGMQADGNHSSGRSDR